MTKTFTPNDVIRYLYKETTQTENQELEKAMICHAELLDQYVQVESVKTLLDSIKKSPSARVIQDILDYSTANNTIYS